MSISFGSVIPSSFKRSLAGRKRALLVIRLTVVARQQPKLRELLKTGFHVFIAHLAEISELHMDRVSNILTSSCQDSVEEFPSHRRRCGKPKVSYLCYPDFDADPHPPLRETVVADLRTLRTHHRDYAPSENPPVLHRKESFVAGTYPLRETFAALTAAEVEAGLLSSAAEIGTLRAWQQRLAAFGFRTVGHQLVKLTPT
jgi:DNA phosphorothioation-associated putative methyltransferase